MGKQITRAPASRRVWGLIVLLAPTIAAPIQAAPQAAYERIVVFGTSLSDPGNAFALFGGTNIPPDYSVNPFLVPDRPYARGGHHFTNGSTWIELFARTQGLGWSVKPAWARPNPGATNYAVAAARAYDDGVNIDLSAQVEAFLNDSGGVAPSDALYVIEMGGNDVRDALAAFASGGNGGIIIQEALTSIAGTVNVLYLAGARRFLIWNAPNVSLTPAIRQLDVLIPGASTFALQLTQGFNVGLSAVMGPLAGLPGIQIARLDAFRLLNDIVGDPRGFGLTNVTDACITPTVAPFVCDQPDDFLFWDGVHPTRAVHVIIAREAALVLTR
jgi:phospholipase/lecithinase/hemolysin